MTLIEATAPEFGHLIQDAVVLNLVRDQGQWVLDPSMADGEPLESALGEARRITADCSCTNTEEHELVEQLRQGSELQLPSSELLLIALADALGYELRKVD
ncbi:hypothetical protein DM793_03925 [Paenarthrobacter nitroguajacolicus]|uniref:hypothetical protein n=1 Tax=Paenarthrobacter nitroguajacolicus TaxID=211146 RepID=UPI0015BF8655|nr:hypothetical protein [Paenarthrobacter nitroguajacolicus]NWL10451.1 hypothetical protein [Paenarthrobacter nitroguajacolicus]